MLWRTQPSLLAPAPKLFVVRLLPVLRPHTMTEFFSLLRKTGHYIIFCTGRLSQSTLGGSSWPPLLCWINLFPPHIRARCLSSSLSLEVLIFFIIYLFSTQLISYSWPSWPAFPFPRTFRSTFPYSVLTNLNTNKWIDFAKLPTSILIWVRLTSIWPDWRATHPLLWNTHGSPWATCHW